MSDHLLIVDHDGDVAILTLNRPASGNAIDVAMADALYEAADELHAKNSARAILLRANGALFSGGGDLAAFAGALAGGAEQASEYLHTLVTAFNRALLRLLAYQAPIIAAVHGSAAGAGMSLALAADLSYLAPKAKLVPAYTGIGLCGDGGISWMLPRLCGIRKATEILMLNTPVRPTEAVALGLVTAALDQDGEAFQEAVLERAKRVAAGPRQAINAVRVLLQEGLASSFENQLVREAESMARLAGGPELPEGLRALREKRHPVYG